MLISLASARLFREKLTSKHVAGIAIAAMGTLTVITGGTLNVQGTNITFLFGSLILLATPFLWATYTLAGKKIMEKYSPFLIVAYVNILGGILLVPFSLADNSFHEALLMSPSEWFAILYLAFTCSLLGYLIWFHVLNQVRAAVVSSFMFAEPLITVLLATVFIGENITLSTLAGGALILTGLLLVTRK
jgi:drug/metabolite transporter (DMT)-like permease